MQPVAEVSDALVLLFCLLFAPSGQKEFAIDIGAPNGPSDTILVARTETGFDCYGGSKGTRGNKMGAVTVQKDRPFAMEFKPAGGPGAKADLTDVQKTIKPFDKNPLQDFTVGSARFQTKGENGKVSVLVGGKKAIFVVRALAAATSTSSPASQPTSASKPAGADDGKEAVRGFLKALAAADMEGMEGAYADNVILMAGSEMLKADWGLAPEGSRDKDQAIGRDKLIGAYRALIGKVGKEKWQNALAKVDPKMVLTSPVQEDEPSGIRKGDLRVDAPLGNTGLTFWLRRDASGKWLVVAERTDY
jgi:hypothetical protein